MDLRRRYGYTVASGLQRCDQCDDTGASVGTSLLVDREIHLVHRVDLQVDLGLQGLAQEGCGNECGASARLGNDR